MTLEGSGERCNYPDKACTIMGENLCFIESKGPSNIDRSEGSCVLHKMEL